MLNISGYQIITKIYESVGSLIFRALRDEESLPVVLKVLKKDHPTTEELTRYKQEYETTRYLNHSGTLGVIGVYHLVE